MDLRCKSCGARAWVDSGSVQRECTHETEGVVANMEAVAYGIGSASVEPEDGRLTLFRAVDRLLAPFRRS